MEDPKEQSTSTHTELTRERGVTSEERAKHVLLEKELTALMRKRKKGEAPSPDEKRLIGDVLAHPYRIEQVTVFLYGPRSTKISPEIKAKLLEFCTLRDRIELGSHGAGGSIIINQNVEGVHQTIDNSGAQIGPQVKQDFTGAHIGPHVEEDFTGARVGGMHADNVQGGITVDVAGGVASVPVAPPSHEEPRRERPEEEEVAKQEPEEEVEEEPEEEEAELVPEEEVEEEEELEPEREWNLLRRLNTAKREEALRQGVEGPKTEEDIEIDLEKVKYAERDEVADDQELNEKIQELLEAMAKAEDVLEGVKPETLQFINERTGLPEDQVLEIAKQQLTRLQEEAEKNVKGKKSKSGWFKTLAKNILPYAAFASLGFFALLPGSLAALTFAAYRGGQMLYKKHKEKKAITEETERIQGQLVVNGSQEQRQYKEQYNASIATAKQEQIDGESVEKRMLDTDAARDAHLNTWRAEELWSKSAADQESARQEYLDELTNTREAYEQRILTYLENHEYWRERPEEERVLYAKACSDLYERNERESLSEAELQAEFVKVDEGKITKFLRRKRHELEEVKFFKGLSEKMKDKVNTGLIFIAARQVAHASSVLGPAMDFWGGMRLGGALGDLMLRKKYGELQDVTVDDLTRCQSLSRLTPDQRSKANLPDDAQLTEWKKALYDKAQRQILNTDFRLKHPTEYAQLKEYLHGEALKDMSTRYLMRLEQMNSDDEQVMALSLGLAVSEEQKVSRTQEAAVTGGAREAQARKEKIEKEVQWKRVAYKMGGALITSVVGEVVSKEIQEAVEAKVAAGEVSEGALAVAARVTTWFEELQRGAQGERWWEKLPPEWAGEKVNLLGVEMTKLEWLRKFVPEFEIATEHLPPVEFDDGGGEGALPAPGSAGEEHVPGEFEDGGDKGGGEAIVPPPVETVPLPAHIGYQGGGDLWHELIKQANVRADFTQLVGHQIPESSLQLSGDDTWTIDALKDEVLRNPAAYNLPANVDIDHLTAEQLKNFDYDKLFNQWTITHQADVIHHVSASEDAQNKEHNRLLAKWQAEHPHETIESTPGEKNFADDIIREMRAEEVFAEGTTAGGSAAPVVPETAGTGRTVVINEAGAEYEQPAELVYPQAGKGAQVEAPPAAAKVSGGVILETPVPESSAGGQEYFYDENSHMEYRHVPGTKNIYEFNKIEEGATGGGKGSFKDHGLPEGAVEVDAKGVQQVVAEYAKLDKQLLNDEKVLPEGAKRLFYTPESQRDFAYYQQLDQALREIDRVHIEQDGRMMNCIIGGKDYRIAIPEGWRVGDDAQGSLEPRISVNSPEGINTIGVLTVKDNKLIIDSLGNQQEVGGAFGGKQLKGEGLRIIAIDKSPLPTGIAGIDPKIPGLDAQRTQPLEGKESTGIPAVDRLHQEVAEMHKYTDAWDTLMSDKATGEQKVEAFKAVIPDKQAVEMNIFTFARDGDKLYLIEGGKQIEVTPNNVNKLQEIYQQAWDQLHGKHMAPVTERAAAHAAEAVSPSSGPEVKYDFGKAFTSLNTDDLYLVKGNAQDMINLSGTEFGKIAANLGMSEANFRRGLELIVKGVDANGGNFIMDNAQDIKDVEGALDAIITAYGETSSIGQYLKHLQESVEQSLKKPDT